MSRNPLRSRLAALGAAFAMLACGAGCPLRRAAPAPAPAPAPPVVVAPPTLTPGARYLASARDALEHGDKAQAAERLEFILALEAGTPERPEAEYTLALLLAQPGSSASDRSRAVKLLGEAVDHLEPASRRAEAGLLLSLLEEEGRQSREIEQLRAWLQTMEDENAQLRSAIDQRDRELQKLKKIKDILLGKVQEP